MDPNMDVSNVGPAAAAVPPARGWWRRNWLWFVPTVFLGAFLLCGGCCAGFFLMIFGTLRASEPYQMALSRVQSDTKVIERLGQPIAEVTWPPPTGEVNWEGDKGEANLTFAVAGPKGGAEVLVQARRVAGQWGLISLHVVFNDGSRHSLEVKEEGDKKGSLGDAPAWKP